MDPAKLKEYAASPAAFRRDILIDSDKGYVKLGDVMVSTQLVDFLDIEAILKKLGLPSAQDDAATRQHPSPGFQPEEVHALSNLLLPRVATVPRRRVLPRRERAVYQDGDDAAGHIVHGEAHVGRDGKRERNL